MNKTCTVTKKWADAHGVWVHFQHRTTMVRKRPMAKATLPPSVPPTTVPVDCSGNGACPCPMDANDRYGICGLAMCDHVDGLRSFGQGKAGFTEILTNVSVLIQQYETLSGGDNGTDEDMLVGSSGGPGGSSGPGIWLTGLANDPAAVVVDHLDVDVTDAALTQYCNDQFYAVCVAWSVPDNFLSRFANGTVWANSDTPDPNNGHFTPLSDVGGPSDSGIDTLTGATVSLNGYYRLWTWGGWCWVSPAFVASVQPQSFVTFSGLQFSKATGYDSHGRHVTEQAAKWVALGGDASKVAAVVAQFPAPTTGPVPTPAPAPAPTPPAPARTASMAQAEEWAMMGVRNHWVAGSTLEQAIAGATAGLSNHWPT